MVQRSWSSDTVGEQSGKQAVSTRVKPLSGLQSALGLSFEVDIASPYFLAFLFVSFLLAFFWIWRARNKRMQSYLAQHGVGTEGYRRVVAEQEQQIQSLKEGGNRAYLNREYETAAELFQRAIQESVALCKLQFPELKIFPFAVPLTDAEKNNQSDLLLAMSSQERQPAGSGVEVFPPPGYFRTRPNADLSLLPVPQLNNFAVHFSNRSACLLAMNRYLDALHDAECARHCQPLWSKGYLRAGQAYEGMGLLSRAKAMYILGTKQDASDANVAKCLRNLREMEAEVDEIMREVRQDEARANRDALKHILDSARNNSGISSTLTTAVSPSPYSSSSSTPPTDKFTALTTWLSNHGAQFPFLYLKQYEHDHRGVHTICRFPANKILLYIPLECIMTSDVARESRVGSLLETLEVDLTSNHSFLACYLLEERYKGDGSFWKSYIDILPQHYRNMPIFFTEEEKTYLKGSFTLGKIEERMRELKAEYEHICQKLDEADLDGTTPEKSTKSTLSQRRNALRDKSGASSSSVTSPKSSTSSTSSNTSSATGRTVKFSERHSLTDFIWARTVVITRIFGFTMTVPNNRGGTEVYKTDGLVPMADMLNHKRPRESSWNFDDARDGFIITSLVPFAAGQQVCDSYGRKCNSRFFVNYGFCLEENREDNQAVVWIELPTDLAAAALTQKKKKFLGIYRENIDDKAASAQSLSQSASSLSSSGYLYSNLLPNTSDASYPPLETLRFQIPTDYNDKITREIFSLIRLVVASDSHRVYSIISSKSDDCQSRTEIEEIESFIGKTFNGEVEYSLRNIPPLSLRNELAVLETLAQAAKKALAQFETTMEQDRELLRKDNEARQKFEAALKASSISDNASTESVTADTTDRLSSNLRNCILQRLGEKEVHSFYVELYQEVQDILSEYEKQVVQRAKGKDSSVVTTASASESGSSPASMTLWDEFVLKFIRPRYYGGEGMRDFYMTTVILPILQTEEKKRKEGLV